MECPQCGLGNREGAKFCKEWGTRFELACPDSRVLNPVDSKFCDDCGHNLTVPSEPVSTEPSPYKQIAKIQRYLPTGLAEKILSQRDNIEGERKQVTVMFCDMAGFTPLVEKLGREESLPHGSGL